LFKIKPIFVIDSKTINFVDMKSIILPSDIEIEKSYVTIHKDGNDFITPVTSLLSYKQPAYIFKGIISQAGISAPTVDSIILNTFPMSEFVYQSVGIYTIELGVDLNNFKVSTIQQTCYNGSTVFNVNGYPVGNYYEIDIYDSTRTLADELLANYTLVIEVYE
jgi:hypothetical protein